MSTKNVFQNCPNNYGPAIGASSQKIVLIEPLRYGYAVLNFEIVLYKIKKSNFDFVC